MSCTHGGTEQKRYDYHSAGLITPRTSKFYLYEGKSISKLQIVIERK
jgi:hypothetical protein